MPFSWSERLLVAGVTILMVNLIMRHAPALHNELVIGVTSWLGAILVIVGVGFMLFLER